MLLVFLGLQAVLAVADPHAFPYLLPLLVIAQLAAIPGAMLAVVMVPAFRALLDERTRILHGLEHATIAVLAERGIFVRHGVTLPGMFDLALPNNGAAWEVGPEIHRAAVMAVRRIIAGERSLAYSPRCGTSFVVGVALASLVIAGLGAIALADDVPAGYTFAGTVVALGLVRLASRSFGLFAQRLLTVSTRLAAASVGRIDREVSPDGALVYYLVHVHVEPAKTSHAIGEPI